MSIHHSPGEEHGLRAARGVAVRRVRRRGASAEEAEDSVQDALLDAMRGAHELRDATGWLTVVAHRRYIDHVRRTRRETASDLVLDRADRTGRDPADVISDAHQARWLVSKLEEMPPVTQQVCQAVGAGLTVPETADSLGLTVRSVENHLTRARKFLRRLSMLGGASLLASIVRSKKSMAVAPVALPVTLAAFAVFTVQQTPATGQHLPLSPSTPVAALPEPPKASAPPATPRPAPAAPAPPTPASTAPAQPAVTVESAPPQSANAPRTVLDTPVAEYSVQEDADATPTTALLHCVEELEVNLDHVGC